MTASVGDGEGSHRNIVPPRWPMMMSVVLVRVEMEEVVVVVVVAMEVVEVVVVEEVAVLACFSAVRLPVLFSPRYPPSVSYGESSRFGRNMFFRKS